MRFTYFFWDFDGTLFDTYPRISRAFSRALCDVRVSHDITEVYALCKVSLGTAARHYADMCGSEPSELMRLYKVHAEDEPPDGIAPYPQARETLAHVIANGGMNFLYTHRGASTLPALTRADFAWLFYDRVLGTDGFPSKPAPDALRYLVQKHNLDISRCMMIGDRAIDVQAGENAGMAGALLDPEGYFADYPARMRFTSLSALRSALMA